MISSEEPSRIPIKNIYYMLVYAWDHPHEKKMISVYDKDEKDLLNLLVKVLLIRLNRLSNGGFTRNTWRPSRNRV
jgi:5-methylcytosine-specific restriction enzyme subunit McrC